jgi:soluble lytic murein transglycosylase-like protein
MNLGNSNLIAILGFGFLVLRVMSAARWALPHIGEKYSGAFERAENKYRIPRGLLGRIAYQESHFREDIIKGLTKSPAGAIGLMQIIPKWHPGVNPTDPIASIDYAGKFLRKMYDQFGSWRYAMAAYNWGPGNLAQFIKDPHNFPMPNETTDYIRQISNDVRL